MQIKPWSDINAYGDHEERKEAFLTDANDTYAILQLVDTEDTEYIQFCSTEELKRMGLEPDHAYYEVVYTEPLLPYPELDVFLENCFTRFNIDRPESFQGHSLSVGDVIAIRQQGELTAHYVEPIGFKEIPDFFAGSNYLRTVEDLIEQNDNSFDGIINNLPEDALPEAFEEQKKPSILEALKECPEPPAKKRHVPEDPIL